MASKAAEVRDLTADDTTVGAKALQSLERNLTHFLISARKETGPKLTFGKKVLVFKPAIPSTAMTELVANDNKIEGLRNYIRLSLKDESQADFDELLSDIPIEALNAIVEVLSEAATPFDTPKP